MTSLLQQPILFASTNKGKVAEAKAVGTAHGITLISPEDVLQLSGGRLSAPPSVEEHEKSYAGNSRLKAQAFFNWCSHPSIGDDTGLEVGVLAGEPGIRSARYAGPGAGAQENVKKLLTILKDVTPAVRRARFVCFLTLIHGDNGLLTVEAELRGSIALAPAGGGGFGYDNIFIVEGYDRTLAELKEQGAPVKTHRILALEKLIEKLKEPA